jgi:hypothetical protein
MTLRVTGALSPVTLASSSGSEAPAMNNRILVFYGSYRSDRMVGESG